MRADRLGDDAYAEAAQRFSSVTPENEMKWEVVEPRAGEFSFAAADEVVEFADDHDQRVRGHALVWHQQLPSWVSGSEAEMRRHIEGVVGHYRGRVGEWDVVNEALSDDGRLRKTRFLVAQGPAYLARAFEIAHEADPDARLVYNDYGAESPSSAKGEALYRLVRALRELRVPIDAVGFQTHATLAPIPGFAAQLRRIAALGVDVELTEVEVRLRDGAGDGVLERQAAAYRRIVETCEAVSRCRSITFWGVDDADSWIPEFFPGFGRALLLDGEFEPKPAYDAVRSALSAG